MYNIDFWDKVKAIRIQRGLRLEDIANVLGVSKQGYSKMEKGLVQKLTEETINKIAAILKVDAKELFKSDDGMLARYTEEVRQWIATPEGREYINKAYIEHITKKMKELK